MINPRTRFDFAQRRLARRACAAREPSAILPPAGWANARRLAIEVSQTEHSP